MTLSKSDINEAFLHNWDSTLDENGLPTLETLRLFDQLQPLIEEDPETGDVSVGNSLMDKRLMAAMAGMLAKAGLAWKDEKSGKWGFDDDKMDQMIGLSGARLPWEIQTAGLWRKKD